MTGVVGIALWKTMHAVGWSAVQFLWQGRGPWRSGVPDRASQWLPNDPNTSLPAVLDNAPGAGFDPSRVDHEGLARQR